MKATNPVPPGYKRTKVGVIPEEWEVVRLGDVVVINSGESPSKYLLSDKKGVPYFKVEQLNNSKKYQEETPYFIQNANKIIKKGSIIFPKRGASIMLNKIRILKHDSYMDTNLMTLTVDDTKVNNEFLYYFLSKVNLSKIADTTSIPQINNKHIQPFKIPLPPLKEQQKIAQILGTWDEAIAKLEALIETKERFKKGLMQKLLSAKLRFPGFEGEWEEVRLGEITTVIMGQSPSSKSYNEEGKGVPLIQGNADCGNRKTSPRMFTTEPTKMCEKGDVIMTVRAPVGYISKSYHNACIGRGVCAIRPHSKNDFLYYFLIMYEERWAKFSQGSTFTAVNSQDIKRLKVPHPSIEEQEKIVEVLSALEREIKLLKDEFEALKEQKRGLMQKLLEGIVRVKG